jgi:hypothetical protein
MAEQAIALGFNGDNLRALRGGTDYWEKLNAWSPGNYLMSTET